MVGARVDICLISDRHAGLLSAIRELQEGSDNHPPIWPDVRNRWCMTANFYDYFRNKDLMNLFKRLCSQNQQRKFNALWKVLNELMLKHREEHPALGSNATQDA